MREIPESIVKDLISLASRHGIWKGAMIGFATGLVFGILLAIIILRGVLS